MDTTGKMRIVMFSDSLSLYPVLEILTLFFSLPDSQISLILIQHGKDWSFAMAIKLHDDFDAPMLRVEAKRSKNGAQARRLLALAAIYEGTTRARAAEIGGVTRQIIWDWVEVQRAWAARSHRSQAAGATFSAQ